MTSQKKEKKGKTKEHRRNTGRGRYASTSRAKIKKGREIGGDGEKEGDGKLEEWEKEIEEGEGKELGEGEGENQGEGEEELQGGRAGRPPSRGSEWRQLRKEKDDKRQ